VSAAALRSRYLGDSINTANPSRLLCMLWDRLVLDIEVAQAALVDGDRETAASRLLHAQDIVLELHASLDLKAWPEGAGLGELYSWVRRSLVAANVNQDPAYAGDALAVVKPLRDTWHEAARALSTAS